MGAHRALSELSIVVLSYSSIGCAKKAGQIRMFFSTLNPASHVWDTIWTFEVTFYGRLRPLSAHSVVRSDGCTPSALAALVTFNRFGPRLFSATT
jgi:hypothetical protein